MNAASELRAARLNGRGVRVASASDSGWPPARGLGCRTLPARTWLPVFQPGGSGLHLIVDGDDLPTHRAIAASQLRSCRSSERPGFCSSSSEQRNRAAERCSAKGEAERGPVLVGDPMVRWELEPAFTAGELVGADA
jgi:hypothetical protein